MSTVIDSTRVHQALDELAEKIAARHGETDQLGFAGIADGGIDLGNLLAGKVSERLGRPIVSGVVNAAFHRDDIGKKPIPKSFTRTDLPFPVDEGTIVLVDDVLFSGRTVRAALSELFDIGRPKCVQLAVLCDRGNRSLPVCADYVGISLETARDQNVEVRINPDNPDEDAVYIS